MIIEVRQRAGRWDATNVVSPTVDVITPIGLDHMEYLGPDVAAIASEKAGIITSDAPVVLGRRDRGLPTSSPPPLMQRGAAAQLGRDFSVEDRVVAVGGWLLTIAGLAGECRDVPAATGSLLKPKTPRWRLAAGLNGGSSAMAPGCSTRETVQAGFAAARSPGRLECCGRRPAIVAGRRTQPGRGAAWPPGPAGRSASTTWTAVVAVLPPTGTPAGSSPEARRCRSTVVVTVNSSPRNDGYR